jgi:hypothetical protein
MTLGGGDHKAIKKVKFYQILGGEEVLFWSLLLKKVKKNTYTYTKTYEIGGS